MKHLGKKGKRLLVCILSLTMFMQCLTLSAVPAGAEDNVNAQTAQTGEGTQSVVTKAVQQTESAETKKSTSAQKEDAAKAQAASETSGSEKKKTAGEGVNAGNAVNRKNSAQVKAGPAGNTAKTQANGEAAKDSLKAAALPEGKKAVLQAKAAATDTPEHETTYVNGVEFTVESDGTEPFDGDDNRGDDAGANNNRIRSYDQMTYNVTASYQAESGVSVAGKQLYYAITVPNNNNLELDRQGSNLENEVTQTVNADGTKTYTCGVNITTQQATGSGGIGRTFVFNVLGMKEGDTFQPTVRCWFGENKQNFTSEGKPAEREGRQVNIATAPKTYVTSAPDYNVILKKGSVSGLGSFKFGTEDSKNTFDETTYSAAAYENETVKGYAVTWGVGVEMRKADASKGIRGIEYPDPTKPLTFDVDLSDVNFEVGKNKTNTATTWAPLLYRVRPNHEGYGDHVSVGDLPGSCQENQDNSLRFCMNSGNYTVTQDGTKLHFTVTDYKIDRTKFPKESLNGNTNYYTDVQKVLEGVFTSAQFTAVYPMVNSRNEDIRKVLGESGNYKFKASADNLKATSVDGIATSSETIPLNANDTDNISETQANVVGGHGRTHEIYFSDKYKQTAGSDGDQSGTMHNKGNDSDSGTLGSQIFFTTCWNENNASIAIPTEGRTVAADQLVLLEGDAIEIAKAARTDHDKTATRGYYLYPMYVTADHALSFDETKTLTMNSQELSYYDNLKDIPENQHVVGVLLRWRGISYSINNKGDDENSGATGALLINQTVANIKNNADYADKVYSITVQSKLYDTSILPDVTAHFTDDETEQAKADAYRTAARELLGDGPLVKTNPKFVPESNGEMDKRNDYTEQPYYDSTGYHGGAGFGRDRADSLYVVPYYTQITKTIAQKDSKGNQKNTYNLDNDERYADYKLTGTLNFSDSGMSYADGQRTTTITIKDTLPVGLKYLKHSAVWNPDSYNEVEKKQGVLKGGTPVEPTIETSSKGAQILTWTIPNVTVQNGDLPPLYYTCSINSDTYNNQKLKNTATIQSSEEKRVICPANKNTSDAGIKITRANGFNINKYGDHDLELNDDATFTLVASNATNTPRDNFLLVDSMPYDGQNNTVMKGKYNVTSITINNDPEVIGDHGTDDIDVYYTTDTKYSGERNINNFPLSEVESWTKATRKNNTQTGEEPSWKVTGWPTAIAIYDTSLGSYKTLLATLHYSAVADKNDHLVNYLLTAGANTATNEDSADAVIYDRALSGTVWVDDNFDGKMDKTEARVPGVKVQLMKQDANGNWQVVTSYRDKDGNTCNGTQITNDQGYYEFTKLPEGKYKVVFTNGDTANHPESDLSQYYMTSKNADKDVKITSKTDTIKKNDEGKLEEGDITGITMPSIDEMKAEDPQNKNNGHYELPDQNMGLYKVERSLEGTAWFDEDSDGVKNHEDTYEKGVTVNLYKNDNGTWKKVDSAQTDEKGHYKFEGLDGGDYEVEFVNDKHSTTKSEKSTDEKMTSIADETKNESGNPTGSRIEKIHMPTDEDMFHQSISNYNLPHQDAGFIKDTPKPTDTPKATETPKATSTPNPVKPSVTPPQNPGNPGVPKATVSPKPVNRANGGKTTPRISGTKNADSTKKGTAPVETGDLSHAGAYAALLILAGAFIIIELIKAGKTRHNR